MGWAGLGSGYVGGVLIGVNSVVWIRANERGCFGGWGCCLGQDGFVVL